MSALSLNNSTLSSFPTSISVPRYKRQSLKAGIVHVGVGGFHRTHQGSYTDNYINHTGDLRWGICGIDLREGGGAKKQCLEEKK